MKRVKNTIPVLDICSLTSTDQINSEVIAEPFAPYLEAHPNLHLPHRHSFYHVVLFTQGGGHHSIDFQQFKVIPRQIYFMKPGQAHRWNFQGQTDGYVVNFSDHSFDSFLANSHYLEQFPFLQGIAEEGVINLDTAIYKEAKAIIEKIVAEVHQPGAKSLDIVRTWLIELFIIIDRSISKDSSGSVQPQTQLLLHNFRKLVDVHYAEKRLPKEYAALLYITPNHLNALCKDLLGKSAGEVIRDRILLEAKRLLINADLSISQIASILNFTDNSHFTRFFKKHTNGTPEEFRRNASGNPKN
jgi:AraC-like DNA-binding protein